MCGGKILCKCDFHPSGLFCNNCVLLQCVIADAFGCQVCPCIDCTEIIFVEGNGLGWLGRTGGGERQGREEGEAAVWNERSKTRGLLWIGVAQLFFQIFWSDMGHTKR